MVSYWCFTTAELSEATKSAVFQWPKMNRSLIELHVPDFNLAKEYYSTLGFAVLWERAPNGTKGYLVLSLNDNILCFWCGNECVYNHRYFKKFPQNTPRGYAVEIVVRVKDLRTYYDRIKPLVTVYQDLKQRPWGLEDFRLIDPFGFYLRFTEEHDIADPKFSVP